jgi:hypothetical protein
MDPFQSNQPVTVQSLRLEFFDPLQNLLGIFADFKISRIGVGILRLMLGQHQHFVSLSQGLDFRADIGLGNLGIVKKQNGDFGTFHHIIFLS